jgi:hypothetical protein
MECTLLDSSDRWVCQVLSSPCRAAMQWQSVHRHVAAATAATALQLLCACSRWFLSVVCIEMMAEVEVHGAAREDVKKLRACWVWEQCAMKAEPEVRRRCLVALPWREEEKKVVRASEGNLQILLEWW